MLLEASFEFEREHHLSPKDIPDFFLPPTGIAIEIKTKHPKRKIYHQCLRYAAYPDVLAVLLITAQNMGNPGLLEGKPFHIFNLNLAWL
jgi:hypothetical protein